MSVMRLIAADELRLMRRNRVAMLGLVMLIVLSLIAALTSITHRDENDRIRARFQQQANSEFDGQPARHPHRVVHYGHFVFRPLPPLAAFDPGVDAFTGNTIYLEGHRQNSANFGDVRQSSLLMRFGQLTPAFVLQALAPRFEPHPIVDEFLATIASGQAAPVSHLLTAAALTPS